MLRIRVILLTAAATLWLWSAVSAQESPAPNFVEGITSYQVFARSGETGVISFFAMHAGPLTAHVVRSSDKMDISSQNWDIGPSSETLKLDKIPVGGDYTVTFTQGNHSAEFDHIMIGDVWVVGGGSNAYGVRGVPAASMPEVRMLNGDNKWQIASDPIFPPPYRANFAPGETLVTPWIAAAQDFSRRAGVAVGLIPYAAPDKPIDFFLDADHVEAPQFQSLIPVWGKGASVFMWFQGEADALQLDTTSVYKDRLTSLVGAVRRYAGNPDMTAVIPQLSYVAKPNAGLPSPYFGYIRQAQGQFCGQDQKSLLIPTLPYDHEDDIRLSAKGGDDLARRISLALDESRMASQIVWQGPQIAAMRFADLTRRRIEIKYTNVRRLILQTYPGMKMSPQDAWRFQWFISDSLHVGIPDLRPQSRNGEMMLNLGGATVKGTETDPQTNTNFARLANVGYILPMRVSVDGPDLVLELNQSAQAGAKLSYALMNDSRGFLTDERGKPAAAFANVPINEP